MKLDYPTAAQLPALRALWQEAFGDTDAFLDIFFSHGFCPQCCRLAEKDGAVAAALYWFDCEMDGQQYAYLYAIATKAAFRRQGICKALMEDTHQILRQKGYCGALLVPENEALSRYYTAMGYRTATFIHEFSATAADAPVALRRIGIDEYAALRRQMLPAGGVLQEKKNLAFLGQTSAFYAGEELLLAVQQGEDGLFIPELLGDCSAAPGVLAALGAPNGCFRAPGGKQPFAMYLPLQKDSVIPKYFGLAFD